MLRAGAPGVRAGRRCFGCGLSGRKGTLTGGGSGRGEGGVSCDGRQGPEKLETPIFSD